ncbi:MAG: hypothetical protein IPH45_19080 [Bacteroidales bacterium]|nr:hypothetical protein [Bacteroidales bacterium]
MKRTLLFLSVILLVGNLFAGELVLIRTKDFQEVRSLSMDGRLTLNYLGNGFVIATKHGSIDRDFILLDDQAWEKDHGYFGIQ